MLLYIYLIQGFFLWVSRMYIMSESPFFSNVLIYSLSFLTISKGKKIKKKNIILKKILTSAFFK